MSLVECTYTTTMTKRGTKVGLLGATRWLNTSTGELYDSATPGPRHYGNNGGFKPQTDGTYKNSRGSILTIKQGIRLPAVKQCPIRSLFSGGQIEFAYAQGLKQGAELLSGCTDNGRREPVRVSRQLFRFWCIDLGLHVPKTTVKTVAKKPGARVLLIDIETAPILGYVWSLWKQNVGLNQIKDEWYILSFCAKWLGEPEIIYQDIRHDPHSDASLMQPLWDLLNEADIIIGQNGKAFDMPKIQARLVMAGHLPPRPYKVIDTLLMAKQQFRFTSNKLEWMTGESAGLTTLKKNQHSKFPGFSLWAECLKGNPEAWDEMKEYNIPDVTSMEELYLKLRPWYVGHPNMAVYLDTDTIACPKCASTNIKQDGFTYTQVGKYEQYHCGDCGGYSRGRYTRNSTPVRKALLSN